MADFKALHTSWKTAKKNAKLAWGMLDKLTADFSSAHTKVTFAVVRFPGFTKGLGPSLDNLQTLTTKKNIKPNDLAKHKQELKKQKGIATTAIQQYDSDIDKLEKSRKTVKVPAVTPTNKAAVQKLNDVLSLVDQEVKAIDKVLKSIDTAVKTVKTD